MKFFILFVSFYVLASFTYAQQPILKIPTAHTAWIVNFAVSHNGNYIATCSLDFTIKLWDYRTKKELRVFTGHTSGISAISFSPDDSLLVSAGSFDSKIKIWNVATGECISTIDSMFNRLINDVCISPDGRIIAGCSENGICAYDIYSKKIIKGYFLSSKGKKVKFFPDSKKLASIETDSSFSVWKVSDALVYLRKESFSYKQGSINDFFISKEGNFVFTAVNSNINNVRMHKVGGKDSIRFAGHSEPALAICAGQSDDEFYSMSSIKNNGRLRPDIEIKKWSVSQQKCVDSLYLTDDDNSVVDKSLLLTKKNDLVVANLKTVFFIPAEQSTPVSRIRSRTTIINGISDQDNICVFTSEDGVIRFLNKANNSLAIYNTHSFISSALFSNDNKIQFIQRIISGNSYISNVLSYDRNMEKTDTLATEKGYMEYEPGLAMTADESLLAYKVTQVHNGRFISDSARFKIRDHRNNEIIRNSGAKQISDLKFLPDNKSYVLCTNVSNKLFLYRDSTVKIMKDSIIGKNDYYFQLEILDSNHVICSDNRGVSIWNLATGKLENKFTIFSNKGTYITPIYLKLSMDKKKFLLARNDTVRLVNSETGEIMQTFSGNMGWVHKMAFGSDSNMILTASIDNTIRAWDTRTGKEKYQIIFIDSTDWIIISPKGYYQCTPAAAKLLHYVTKDYKIITFEQLDTKYNRPDKVLEAMNNKDSILIKSYKKAWEKRIRKLGIDTTGFRDGYSVPESDFANRKDIEYEQRSGSLDLHIKGMDSTYKLDRFNIWVNEVPLYGQRGINLRHSNINIFDSTLTIKLSLGANTIETSITNINGTESYRMPLEVNYTPGAKQSTATRFIGIGIDQFADTRYNLHYSVKDIRDLSVKLKEKYKGDIIIDTLFNENVSLSNVKALKKYLLRTTENDKVIIAYSGHGLLSKDFDYYLSTYSVNFEKPELNGLPYDELENLLDSIPARKKLLLIDACHSGEVDKDELVRISTAADSMHLKKGAEPIEYKDDEAHLGMKNSFELMQSLFVNVGKSTGATIISAAGGTQFALERGDLKNGVFTYAILEAMQTYPTIKISELKKIVGERVVQLTNGLQKPTSRNETIAVDWEVW